MGVTRAQLQSYFNTNDPCYAHITPDQMAILVDSVKKYLADEDIQFNCPIIKASGGAKYFNLDELRNFLTQLNQFRNSIPEETRLQYLFQFNAHPLATPHWTVTDILINKGHLEIYILDPYQSNVEVAIQLILMHEIFNSDYHVNYTALSIQKDTSNCGYFTMNLLVSLLKNPVHSQLSVLPVHTLVDVQNNPITFYSYIRGYKEYEEFEYGKTFLYNGDYYGDGYPEDFSRYILPHFAYLLTDDMWSKLELASSPTYFKMIHRDSLPLTWGAFFKNTQDTELEVNNYVCIKRTPKPPTQLSSSIRYYNFYNRVTNKLSQRNGRLEASRGKFKKIASNHLESLTDVDFDHIIQSRQGEYLPKLLSMSQDHPEEKKSQPVEKVRLDDYRLKDETLPDPKKNDGDNTVKEPTKPRAFPLPPPLLSKEETSDNQAVQKFFAEYKSGYHSFWSGQNKEKVTIEMIVNHAVGYNSGCCFFGYSGRNTRNTLRSVFGVYIDPNAIAIDYSKIESTILNFKR